MVKGKAPHLKHITKKTRRFSWCSSLERLPAHLFFAFPLSFVIFGKDFKPKSDCFLEEIKGKDKKGEEGRKRERKSDGRERMWKSVKLSLF